VIDQRLHATGRGALELRRLGFGGYSHNGTPLKQTRPCSLAHLCAPRQIYGSSSPGDCLAKTEQPKGSLL
jgi:hypothetical protein